MKSLPQVVGPDVIAELKERLLADRRSVLAGLGAAGSDRAAANCAGVEHPLAAEVLSRLGEDEFVRFSRIEAALHRIGFHSYGFCSRCSTPIGIERLRADPAVASCSRCAIARGSDGLTAS